MRRYYGITVPVWIFLLTLVLIVLSGSIVGDGSCEGAIDSCESRAIEAHPGDSALQQAYVSNCTASACSSGKRAAVVPFSILVLGVVLYVVWLRTGDSGATGPSTLQPAGAASDPAPAGSSVAPVSRQAAAAPSTSAAPSEPATTSTPNAQASPTAEETAVYLDAIHADGEAPKEELARALCRLTGIPDADRWKSAPAGDLALLGRAIATAALLSPADSRYRSRAGAHSTGDEFDALTKKALHQQCIEVLRADLLTLAGADACPEGLSESSVRETIRALDPADALAGLSRLSKSTLVSLAAFLQGPRA